MPERYQNVRALSNRVISDEFVAQLREALVSRYVSDGFRLLSEHQLLIEACEPRQKNAAILLGYLAQWIDIGFPSTQLIKELLARFPNNTRESLTILECAHLKMADGLVAMRGEEFDRAIRCFETVLALQEEIQDKQVISIANYWVGRCLRRCARYDDAQAYVTKAHEMALELKYPRMAAVMRVLEGWIAFQEGKPEVATRILREAEDVLAQTDDLVTLGNISSAYGRIARRQGNYDLALSKFEKAITLYEKRDPYNRNLARSFVNIAFVKRLLALQLRNKMDTATAQQRRKRSVKASSSRLAHGHEQLMRLRNEAFEHLKHAREIYDRYDDHRGNGNVYITFGYLHLDNGELDLAASMGNTAYQLGEEKRDNVLKARARMLQSAVECAKFEEQIEDTARGVSSSQMAPEFAREALDCAKHTQNRRLIAKAYITLGLALCLDFSDDLEAARKCAEEATALLKPMNHDYVWKELQELLRRLRSGGNINETLREWSRGIVSDKTFQQVSEEFAAIVISKVWRREGCKVARVANRLSISPKKVRRILRAQGLRPGSRPD